MPKQKFDLDAELKSDPPKPWKRPSVWDHPRIQEWVAQLLAMRAEGGGITHRYMAEKLTKGARLEGIIRPDAEISEDSLRVALHRRTVARRLGE